MSRDEVLSKVRKLLALATSPNEAEAAAAAAKAQELIARHGLSAAAVEVEDGRAAEPDEPVVDFGADPVDRGRRMERWRVYLASGVARANGCRIYLRAGVGIALVGRPSDVAAARYLYGWLSREVVRLRRERCVGYGRVYSSQFALGVVDTVRRKLREADAAARDAFRAERFAAGGERALVVVDRAVALYQSRGADVERWMAGNMRLRKGGSWGGRSDPGARSSGRTAGESINVTGARGRIGSSPRLIQ